MLCSFKGSDLVESSPELSANFRAKFGTSEGGLLNGKGQTPLHVAETGGRHAGFLRQRLGRTSAELLSEAKTLRQARRRASGQDHEPNRLQQGQR